MKWKGGTGTTLNGFLDRGSLFQGDLTFEETFRIDGKFEGTIRSGSELILGDSAEVNAEIYVRRLSVNGTLSGSVDATEKVEILSKARVSADVRTPILKVEEGAFFQGRCHMETRLVPMPAPPPPAEPREEVKQLKTKKL